MRTSGEAVLNPCRPDEVESGPPGPGEAESGPRGSDETESLRSCRLGMSLVLINSTSLGIPVLDP